MEEGSERRERRGGRGRIQSIQVSLDVNNISYLTNVLILIDVRSARWERRRDGTESVRLSFEVYFFVNSSWEKDGGGGRN